MDHSELTKKESTLISKIAESAGAEPLWEVSDQTGKVSFLSFKDFRLPSTSVQDIMQHLSQMTGLVALDLSHTGLTAMPRTQAGVKTGKPFSRLARLIAADNDFSGGNLGVLDEMGKLEKLELQNCQMGVVPETLASKKSLSFLDLSGNKITSIPSAAANKWADNLKYLMMNGCDLSGCSVVNGESPGFFELFNLEEVHMVGCNLSSIPAGLRPRLRVKYVELADNKISEMPENMHEWSIKFVDLSGNPVASSESNFPPKTTKIYKTGEKISAYHEGKRVGLQNNSISSIPSCVSKLFKANHPLGVVIDA